jgi:hypothetical protein
MGEIVGDQPQLREFGSDTDSELEELLLTAPTIPQTVPSSEADSNPECSDSPEPNTSSDDKPSAGNPTRRRRGRRSRNKNRKRASTTAPVVAAASPSADHGCSVACLRQPRIRPILFSGSRDSSRKRQIRHDPRGTRCFHARDRTRKSRVATIKQTDFATALRLFTMNHSRCVIPEFVLADTGADLGMCISEELARDLKLTWTPCTSPLAQC